MLGALHSAMLLKPGLWEVLEEAHGSQWGSDSIPATSQGSAKDPLLRLPLHGHMGRVKRLTAPCAPRPAIVTSGTASSGVLQPF